MYLIKAGKDPQYYKTFEFQDVRESVGGHVMPLPIIGECLMLVNEDGGPLGLPENKIASEMYGSKIVGDVVIMERSEFEKLK